jgi:hypothetical protein
MSKSTPYNVYFAPRNYVEGSIHLYHTIKAQQMETNQIMVKMVFDRWNSLIEKMDGILASLSDEQLEKEIAPGRSRGIYLLGHLIAVHDDMIPLLNLGDKLYPELHEIFIKSPDRSTDQIPSAKELRAYWTRHNKVLTQKF